MKMQWKYNDGGRKAAGYRGDAGDCVVRAIAIATGEPYQVVYDAINGLARDERSTRGKRSTARNGVWRKTYQRYIESLGWKWHPTMSIGTGCKVHLRASELPAGRLIVRLSKHLCAVIDGVIHDTYNPCDKEWMRPLANGRWESMPRCVYGYFVRE